TARFEQHALGMWAVPLSLRVCPEPSVRRSSKSTASAGREEGEELPDLLLGGLPAVLADLESLRVLDAGRPVRAVPFGQARPEAVRGGREMRGEEIVDLLAARLFARGVRGHSPGRH